MVNKLKIAIGALALNIAVQALKVMTHVHRPNCYNYRSFPSGRAANAWYIATIVSFDPLVTLLATLVSYTRVIQGWHRPIDVFVGGAMGLQSLPISEIMTFSNPRPF